MSASAKNRAASGSMTTRRKLIPPFPTGMSSREAPAVTPARMSTCTRPRTLVCSNVENSQTDAPQPRPLLSVAARWWRAQRG